MNNFGLEASAHPPCKDNIVQHKDALMHILKSERCWQWKKSKRVFQLGFGLSQKLFQTPQKAKEIMYIYVYFPYFSGCENPFHTRKQWETPIKENHLNNCFSFLYFTVLNTHANLCLVFSVLQLQSHNERHNSKCWHCRCAWKSRDPNSMVKEFKVHLQIRDRTRYEPLWRLLLFLLSTDWVWSVLSPVNAN